MARSLRLTSALTLASVLSLALAACGTAAAPPAPASSALAPAPAPGGAAPQASAATLPTVAIPDGPGTRFRIVPETSEALYRAQEKFVRLAAPNKAVGTTKTLAGEFRVDLAGEQKLLASKFVVDLRTLKSDEPRRDNALQRRWLESSKYPYAEFTATEVQRATALPDGQTATFKLAGTLKVHDTEKPVVWDVQATLKGDTLTGQAATHFKMSQFNIPPPDIVGMLTVDDPLDLEFRFTAKRAE